MNKKNEQFLVDVAFDYMMEHKVLEMNLNKFREVFEDKNKESGYQYKLKNNDESVRHYPVVASLWVRLEKILEGQPEEYRILKGNDFKLLRSTGLLFQDKAYVLPDLKDDTFLFLFEKIVARKDLLIRSNRKQINAYIDSMLENLGEEDFVKQKKGKEHAVLVDDAIKFFSESEKIFCDIEAKTVDENPKAKIDILGWREKDGKIIGVECKRVWSDYSGKKKRDRIKEYLRACHIFYIFTTSEKIYYDALEMCKQSDCDSMGVILWDSKMKCVKEKVMPAQERKDVPEISKLYVKEMMARKIEKASIRAVVDNDISIPEQMTSEILKRVM